jgi:isoleucyl-tRNA synthetase
LVDRVSLLAVNALSHFANITLSSLYFDITKDCLYADAPESKERRAVATVLEEVLRTMTKAIAPVLPHLAEEIHANMVSMGLRTRRGEGKGKDGFVSVFKERWVPLSERWCDHVAEEEMGELLRVRDAVLALLENARGEKSGFFSSYRGGSGLISGCRTGSSEVHLKPR